MEVGALVVTQGSSLQPSGGNHAWSSAWPVVGKTVLERWLDRVRALGTGPVSVVDHDVRRPNRLHTMMDWAKQGVDQILLIVLGSYAEIDLTDLLQFHHQGRYPITRVFDTQGPLGINLLDRGAVLKSGGRYGIEDARNSSRYEFSGYVTRLSSTVAYRKLVQDALDGKCAIQVSGQQAAEKVWIDPTAQVDATAKIEGPCYIGARTKLNAGVVIKDYSSVERDSEVDIGTTLDGASILPNTYVAPGLRVRNSVIDGTRLENLERGVIVDLGAVSLSARKRPHPLSAMFPLRDGADGEVPASWDARTPAKTLGPSAILRRPVDDV